MAKSSKSHPKAVKEPFRINGNVEGLYRQLVEQSADGVFTIGLKGEVLFANRAAKDIVKFPAKSIIGKHFMFFVDKGSRATAREYIKKVKSGVETIRDELVICDRKGKLIPIEFTSSPIYKDNSIAQIHISIRDISHRKQMERYARESHKMSAIQDLISGTTHEIQYPLKGLYEQTDTLIKKYKLRDFEYIGFKEFTEIFETLENMKDQARYCCDTTDRLINISKRKVGIRKNRSDINNVIRSSVLSLKDNIAKYDINLKTNLSKKVPSVAIGEIELGQVIVSVITNAVQALTPGGKIEIKTSYLQADNMVKVDCIDNGIGISKDDLSRVFDPFFTTKERGLEKSSGLGLAIVYSIVKSFQGSISITSNLKKGTRVKLLLPAYTKKRKK